MALNSELYRAALATLGPNAPVFIQPPAAFETWLTAKCLPKDLTAFLLANAVDDGLAFPNGSGGMWTPTEIMDLNDQESLQLASGLLGVGNSTNGDFIVIDLESDEREAGFVSHDELWDHPPEDARQIYRPVAESIHDLLKGMSDQLWKYRHGNPLAERGFPIDYYSAPPRTKRN